jgi:hypothetical protein
LASFAAALAAAARFVLLVGEEGAEDEAVVVAVAAAATAVGPLSLLKESVVSVETRGTDVSMVGGLGFCFRRNLDILSMT